MLRILVSAITFQPQRGVISLTPYASMGNL